MAADITKTGPIGLKGINRQQANDNADIDVGHFYNLWKNPNAFNNVPEENVGIQAAQVGYGDSQYDENITSVNQFEDINDIRANEQPWYDQIANGVAKMGGTALTTFLSSFGTLGAAAANGVGQIGDLISGEDNTHMSEIWDNDFTRTMTDIDNYMEESFKNYQTEAQQNKKWYERFGDAAFWADDVIKNMGFTLSAMASGSVFSGGLGLMGKALNIAGQASKAGSVARNAASALFSASGEGAIEAKNLMDEMGNQELARFQEYMKPQFDAVQAEYMANRGKTMAIDAEGNAYDPAYVKYKQQMDALNQKREAGLQEINDRIHQAGNADFLGNLPLLTMSNMIQFAKGFNKSYNNARRIEELSKKTTGAGRIETRLNKAAIDKAAKGEALDEGEKLLNVTSNGVKKRGIAWNAIKNPLTEGSEEMNQKWIQKAAEYYQTADNPEDYWKAKLGTDAEKQAIEGTKDAMQAITAGLSNSWGNFDEWEDFAIGALTGALGTYMPTKVFNQDKTKSKFNPLRYGSWEGGVYGDVSEYMNKAKNAQANGNDLDSRVNTEDFAKRMRNIVAHTYYQNEIDNAILDDNKKAAKDAEDKQFAADVEAFVRAGKTDDLRAIYNSFANNSLSDEDIENYINSATQNISEEEDRNNKIAPLVAERDKITKQGQAISEQLRKFQLPGELTEEDNKEIINLKNKRQELLDQYNNLTTQINSIHGQASSVNPYYDTKGNPIDKDGNVITKERQIENVRQEIIGNGNKANQKLDMYLNAANKVQRDSNGKLNNDQEDYLTYLNYRSQRSRQRAAELIDNNVDKIGNETFIGEKMAKTISALLPKENKDAIKLDTVFAPEEGSDQKEGEKVYSVDITKLPEENRGAYVAMVLSDQTAMDDILDDLQREYNTLKDIDTLEAKKRIQEIDNTVNDIKEAVALSNDAVKLDEEYQNKLNNPGIIDKEATKAATEKQNNDNKSKFDGKSAKDIKADMDSGDINFDDLDAFFANPEVKEEDKKEAQIAKDISDAQSALKGFAAQAPTDVIAQDAANLVDFLASQAESADDFNMSQFEAIDTMDMIPVDEFNEMAEHLTPDEMQQWAEERKKNALEFIASDLEQFQKDKVAADKIPTNDSNSGTLSFDDEKETGHDSTPSPQPIVNTPDNTLNPVSNQTSTTIVTKAPNNLKDTKDSSNPKTPNNPIQPNTQQSTVNTNNGGTWRNTTRRYAYHNDTPYHETLQDKNGLLYRRSKAIYDYLMEHHAFDTVENADNDRLKPGDKIRFYIIDLSNKIFDPMKELTPQDKKDGMVIFMVNEKGEIIGDLPYPTFEPSMKAGNPNKDVTTLQALYDKATKSFFTARSKTPDIMEAYLGGETKGDGIALGMTFKDGSPLTTTIAEVKQGRVPYLPQGEYNTLNDIAGNALQIGVKVTNDGNINIGSKSFIKTNEKSGNIGQPYIVIPDASGTPQVIPFTTPVFNTETMKDKQIYKILRDNIQKAINSEKEADRNAAMNNIYSLLQIDKGYIESHDPNQFTFKYETLDGAKHEITFDTTEENWEDKFLSSLNNIPVNISLQKINKDFNSVPYNSIIGEIANANIPKNTTHTVNTWFTVNPLTSKGQRPARPVAYTRRTNVIDVNINGTSVRIVPGAVWYATDTNGKRIDNNNVVDLEIARQQAIARGVTEGNIKVDINGETRTYNVKDNKFIQPQKPKTPLEKALDYLNEHPEGSIDDLFNSVGVDDFAAIALSNTLQGAYGLQVSGSNNAMRYKYTKPQQQQQQGQQQLPSIISSTSTQKPPSTLSTISTSSTTKSPKDSNNPKAPTDLKELWTKNKILNRHTMEGFNQLTDEAKTALQNGQTITISCGSVRFTINTKGRKDAISTALTTIGTLAKSKPISITISPLHRTVDRASRKKANLEKELKWLDTHLPQLGREERVKVIHGLLQDPNSKEQAWGRFEKGSVILSDAAARGTVYHEAFHVVTQTILSSDELNKLYQEAQKKYKKDNPALLEELMAEDFRRYTQLEETPVIGYILKVFRRIKNAIMNTMNIKPSIEQLFYKINNGDFALSELDNRSNNPFHTDNTAQSAFEGLQQCYQWNNLSTEQKQNIKAIGLTKDTFESMSTAEKEQYFKCLI